MSKSYKNTMCIKEFSKQLKLIGDTNNYDLECRPTFWHDNKEYNDTLIIAFKLSWDWCQGFKLNDGSIWAIAKVKTVPIKLLKSLEDTKKICEDFSNKYNQDVISRKNFLKEMTEAYYTKEKPYSLLVFGCDDSSYSQSFATMKEIEKLINNWSKNPPDTYWKGAIFTN